MHKEPYFTKETIEKKGHELMRYVSISRQRHADIKFNLDKAALLVLDMQEYFLQPTSHAFIPSAPAIVLGINELIEAFEKSKRPVVATRHLNTPADAGMMSEWWRDLITQQDAYSQYGNSIHLGNSVHINKTQYDAFFHTHLEETLRAHDIEQVLISGVMTHLCCETTARSAFMRGFEVFFTVDGTATYHEELHRASLLTLSHGFAVPVSVGEILAGLKT